MLPTDRAAAEFAVGRVNFHRHAMGRKEHRRLDVCADIASWNGRKSKCDRIRCNAIRMTAVARGAPMHNRGPAPNG